MIYDVPFRYQQALDPSALTNVLTTLHAITKGVEDCRHAGVDPNSDPALSLLIRHMGRIASNQASEPVLRSACERRVEQLRRFPALLALSVRGVEYDPAAKEQFHHDAREAVQRLAVALGLAEGTYEVRSFMGTVADSGYVILAARDLAVMVRVGARFEGREVAYRAVLGDVEQANRYAGMADLLRADRFAIRLRRELQLADTTTKADKPALIAA